MRLLNQYFRERNQVKVGLVGAVAVVLLTTFALNIGALRSGLLGADHIAQFAESGGLRPGDDVRVAGLTVGKVDGVEIVDQHVDVAFTLDEVEVGSRSKAAIKSDNALGRRYLAVTPAGAGNADVIPVARTTSPYGVTDALSDLTDTTGELDVDQLAASLDSVSSVLEATPDSLRSTVNGVGRLSASIAERDQQLQELFARAANVSDVLAERSAEITALMSDSAAFFAELQARRHQVHQLLVNTTAAAAQIRGLIRDNEDTLGSTLRELDGVIKLLERNKASLEYGLKHLGAFIRSLGEAVGAGPFFYAYLQNLVPADLAPVIPELVSAKGEKP